jgi:hypothetical protein
MLNVLLTMCYLMKQSNLDLKTTSRLSPVRYHSPVYRKAVCDLLAKADLKVERLRECNMKSAPNVSPPTIFPPNIFGPKHEVCLNKNWIVDLGPL